VIDAIPYNAALMQEQGLNVCINSDDAEMGRRLNQEAAKAVKYGGISEEEAWKFVTLNPAKLLHLDKRMGSIKEGKDADIVIWNNNPLSIYAIPEYTFVDGACYYSKEKNSIMNQQNEFERAQIITNILSRSTTNSSDGTQLPTPKLLQNNHCINEDDMQQLK
jgi:adenine deaminase